MKRTKPRGHTYQTEAYESLYIFQQTLREIENINNTPSSKLTKTKMARLEKLHNKSFNQWLWLIDMVSIGIDACQNQKK